MSARGDVRARPDRSRRARPGDRLDGGAGGRAAADVGVLRAHGHAEAAPLRLHHADPLADAPPARPTTRGRSPPPRAGCSPTPGPAAACGCSASASRGCRSTRRATCSPRTTTARRSRRPPTSAVLPRRRRTAAGRASAGGPGQDVVHDELGAGWVWGRGLGRVTVRFEGPRTAPGPVRTLAADDPVLHPADRPTGGPRRRRNAARD